MQGLRNKYYRFTRGLKGWGSNMSWQLGIGRNFVKKARGSRILVYHGLCLEDHLRYNTLFITLRSFEEQIHFYKKYCNIISLDDYYHQRFDHNKFNVCLTFDDGFANNFKYVLPLLEKYKIPAAFFITGICETGQDILWNDVLAIAYRYGPKKIKVVNEVFTKRRDGKYISSKGELLVNKLRSIGYSGKKEMIDLLEEFKHKADPDYWLQMTTAQIKELSANSWATIGSHGYYHNDLAVLPADKARDEMIRSKEYLENLTGKKIKAIAFPYGSCTNETLQEAKNIGYEQLLATDFLFNSDKEDTTIKERLTINPFITPVQQLRANIRGKY